MKTPLSVIIQIKGSEVVTIRPDAAVFDAVTMMETRCIGSLPVVDTQGEIVGMLTERDCLRKVLLKERNLHTVKVSEVMSTPVFTLPPETPVEECMKLMTAQRIRHLPVVEKGKLLGLISIGDAVKFLCSEHEQDIVNLEKYITGSL
ncbi:MAG: CBS domain-containing protein [Pontiellaceae bacterium]|jgi:CBS domain-containing protein|nr:CBS domain-containing protein [Pontiellaceae bacterium]